MAIYKFENNRLSQIENTTFSQESILERQNLQQALKQQIQVIAPDCLVISEEFSDWTDSHRRIDLLAIDKQANLVVIELKRNETGENMELQAIRYASMVSTMTFSEATSTFQEYLLSVNSEDNAEATLLNFLNWDEPQDSFARDVKIILVSSNFSKELTTSVLWLNERDLNIKCVRLIPYKYSDNNILIDVQQIIPLPEAETYQLRIRHQSEARKESASKFDFTQYRFNNVVYKKRRLVLAVIQQWIADNKPDSFEKLLQAFPQSLKNGGIFKSFEDANNLVRNGIARHFLDDDEVISFNNEIYAISNQWGINTIKPFLERARELGYIVEEVPY